VYVYIQIFTYLHNITLYYTMLHGASFDMNKPIVSFTMSSETKRKWDKIDPNFNKSKLVESLIIEFLKKQKRGSRK